MSTPQALAGSNSLADLAARMRAKNEAQFPRLKEIKTHPALDCIPLMREAEFNRLVWSIKKIGQVDPIVQDEDGRILDGRCRFLACEIAGTQPALAKPNNSVAAYIFAKNIARRHLSQGQRAMIAALMEDLQDDGFVGFIRAANILRMHQTPSALHLADAMVEEPDYPHQLVMPEARLVVQYKDLVQSVWAGLSLAEVHGRALERQREAAVCAEQAARLEHLRTEAPYLALQVDEGELTSAEAVEAHEDQLAAPVLAEHAAAIRDIAKRVLDDVIEVGQRLTECKALLRHGAWLSWLEREFGWSDDTALNFMRVSEMAKSRTVRDLSLLPVSGLYLLAKPSTPDGVRDDVLRRAAIGEAPSVAEIRRTIDQARGKPIPAKRLGDQLRDLTQRMSKASPEDPLVAELHRLVFDGAAASNAEVQS